ncbi:MAG TPA: hypothetical protein VJ761_22515 [Ktedonobacteraceae bacterium]|nr:hypothetical protein [Ktedonobacteraceae bacterium]
MKHKEAHRVEEQEQGELVAIEFHYVADGYHSLSPSQVQSSRKVPSTVAPILAVPDALPYMHLASQ